MRLKCPNCGAQYEVPDAVIPDEGRDVQCSNCGNTWFQAHPDRPGTETPKTTPASPPASEPAAPEPAAPEPADEEPAQEPPAPEPSAAEPVDQDPARAGSGDEAPPEDSADADDLSRADADSDRDDADQDAEPPANAGWDDGDADMAPETPPAGAGDDDDGGDDQDDDGIGRADDSHRRQLDPAISRILRTEAEYEARQRASESGDSLENQPDLGLDSQPDDEAARRSREARERMARMRGEDAGPPGTAETGEPVAETDLRHNQLPDIEEISSSLRSAGDGSGPQNALSSVLNEPEARRSGFARGFGLVVIITVVLVLLYTNARSIAQSVPQLEPALGAYVAMIDKGRVWLDTTVSGFTPK